jgi:hypothetical protein
MIYSPLTGVDFLKRLMTPVPPSSVLFILVELLREGQLAGAMQMRIERPKDGGESFVLIFGPSRDPQLAEKGREIKSILGIRPDIRELRVNYGATGEKMTRST